MINMNNIPGLEETPKDLNSAYDKCVVFEIVDRFADENNFSKIDGMTRRAQVYKKLLDNQMKLVKNLREILKHHEKPYLHEFSSSGLKSFMKLGDLYAESAFDLIEEITGKTWEELNE